MTTTGQLKYCSRCKGDLISTHGEISCLSCGWQPMTPEMGGGVSLTDSAALGAAALSKLAELAKRIAGHERAIAESKAEGQRFLTIADLCEADVTPATRHTFAIGGKKGTRRAQSPSTAPLKNCQYCNREMRAPNIPIHERACPKRPGATEAA